MSCKAEQSYWDFLLIRGKLLYTRCKRPGVELARQLCNQTRDAKPLHVNFSNATFSMVSHQAKLQGGLF